MGTKLTDLNDMLFKQLERLSNPEVTGAKLASEIERTRAMSGLAGNIITNARLVLDAETRLKNKQVGQLPKMLDHKIVEVGHAPALPTDAGASGVPAAELPADDTEGAERGVSKGIFYNPLDKPDRDSTAKTQDTGKDDAVHRGADNLCGGSV